MRVVVVSVLVALTATACSGGDSDGGEGGASTAPPTTTAPAPAPETTGTTSTPAAGPTLLELVRADDRLGRVAAALERPELADLAARLDDPRRPMTLFAPVDGGLPGVTDPDLAARLPSHAVEGTYLAADLAAEPRLRTLAGTTLVVTDGEGGARVGTAALVTTDVEAVNGVVHLVDGPVSRAPPRAG